MLVYIIRRFLYAVPIVLGVLLLTFLLFFVVNKPDDMARSILGEKASDTDVEKWKREHNYHLPRFYNPKADGLGQVTNTLFFQKCARLLIFDFGRSDVSDRPIAGEIRRRMGPSLAITVPTFLLGMAVNITIALIVAVCRGTYLDRWGTVICVFMMSVSSLFYIIVGQFIFAQWLRLFPISGFDWGPSLPKFVFLPVLIGLVRGIGGGVRFYRTVMLEEVGRDYVRTARAKGLGEGAVLFKHVLKNAMVPILT
ncbi:ABC transporter permease, partial [bacterium]|nr:ABC transporter permease [bacterium]